MKSVKQVGDELSGIMLIVTCKHRLELAEAFLEVSWRERTVFTQPQIFDQFGVFSRKLSVSA